MTRILSEWRVRWLRPTWTSGQYAARYYQRHHAAQAFADRLRATGNYSVVRVDVRHVAAWASTEPDQRPAVATQDVTEAEAVSVGCRPW